MVTQTNHWARGDRVPSLAGLGYTPTPELYLEAALTDLWPEEREIDEDMWNCVCVCMHTCVFFLAAKNFSKTWKITDYIQSLHYTNKEMEAQMGIGICPGSPRASVRKVLIQRFWRGWWEEGCQRTCLGWWWGLYTCDIAAQGLDQWVDDKMDK